MDLFMNFNIQGLTPFVTVQPAPGREPGPAFYVVRSYAPHSASSPAFSSPGVCHCGREQMSVQRQSLGLAQPRPVRSQDGREHGVHSGPTEKNSSLTVWSDGEGGLPVQEAKDKALLEPHCAGLLVSFRIVSFWQLCGPGRLPLVMEMSRLMSIIYTLVRWSLFSLGDFLPNRSAASLEGPV